MAFATPSVRDPPALGLLCQAAAERLTFVLLLASCTCRVRKKRLHVDPESLVPQLPKPRDLQPFPTTLALRFEGHTGKVRTLSPHVSGQWLLSGSDDGTVKVWEVRTGRCMKTWSLGGPVSSVAWCPANGSQLFSACVGSKLALLVAGIGGDTEAAAEATASLKVRHGCSTLVGSAG